MCYVLFIHWYTKYFDWSNTLILWHTKYFDGLRTFEFILYYEFRWVAFYKYFVVLNISIGCVLLILWYTKYLSPIRIPCYTCNRYLCLSVLLKLSISRRDTGLIAYYPTSGTWCSWYCLMLITTLFNIWYTERYGETTNK